MHARTILAVLLSSVILGPSVMADHGLIPELQDSARRTTEPDSEVLRCAGCVLDGRENRVTYPGATPGDGSLFLDMRLGTRVGPDSPPGFDLYAGAVLEPVSSGRPILLPGGFHATAWYGTWNDLDGDRVIDDIHDAAQGGAGDEFRWRGVATGEAIAMPYYVSPSSYLFVYGAGYGARIDSYELVDGTGDAAAHQDWHGSYSPTNTDAGFLADIQVLTLAGAPRANGGVLAYDIDHPDALYDVDSYEAVSPDVAALWTAATVIVRDGQQGAITTFWDTAADAAELYGPYYNEHVDPRYRTALALVGDPFFAVTLAFDETSPKDKREPNTPEDDFEGRAFHGGVGDVPGSYNQYPGHLDGFHMWFDTRPQLVTCAGVWADPGGIAVDAGAPICFSWSTDPVAQQTMREGSSAALLSFNADIFLWHDKNGDGMVGPACDPNDPDQFDQARNTCADRFHGTDAYAFYAGNTESVSACTVATARGSAVTVTPIGGDWPPSTFFIPDYKQTTRPILQSSLRLLEGREAVDVRWPDTCSGNGTDIDARDAILFPTSETLVPLRTETRATIEAFVDHDRGIANGRESVTDVDVIPAFTLSL